MKAYSYDEEGYFSGEVECQKSPLEKGKFLVPANATPVAVPPPQKDKEYKFNVTGWITVESRESIKNKERIELEKPRPKSPKDAELEQLSKDIEDFTKMKMETLDDVLIAMKVLQRAYKR